MSSTFHLFRFTFVLFLMVAALAALAACGPEAATPTGVPAPTGTPANPTATTAPADPTATTPQPGATMTPTTDQQTSAATIVYTRTGGMIGETTRVEIRPDGTALVQSDRQVPSTITFTLGADLSGRVQAAAAAVDWENLEDEYLRGDIPDALQYFVTYSSGAMSRTVRTGTMGGAPEELTALIAVLDEVIVEANRLGVPGTPAITPTAGQATPASTPTSGQPTPASTPTSGQPTPAAGGRQALLAYHLTGGFAGVDNYVYLRGDGTAFVSTRRPQNVRGFELDPALWADVQQAIAALDWNNLEESYRPEGVVSDALMYDITHFGNSALERIYAETGATFPPGLERLITLLDEVIAAAATAGTPESTDAAGFVLLDYSAVGGIAGRTERVVVTDDGSAWLVSDRPARNERRELPADVLSRLQEAVAAVDWSSAQPDYLPTMQVSDGIDYSVTYLGPAGHRTLRTATAGSPPVELALLLRVLQEIGFGL